MLFKMKSRKRGMHLVRGSLMSGGSMVARRIANSMKNAARLGYMVGRNPALSMMVDRMQRRAIGSVAAVIGMGLAVFGLINLIRR